MMEQMCRNKAHIFAKLSSKNLMTSTGRMWAMKSTKINPEKRVESLRKSKLKGLLCGLCKRMRQQQQQQA